LVNNPIYIAEEFAMLDNLSKGRIITGFVRGIGSEYHSSGTNPYFPHERFHEAHDLIIRAWTEPGPFAFDGDHFSLRYVNLWPTPYQSPHPPVWIPSQGSSETVAWAADPSRKYPFSVTFSSADLVARYHNTYRDEARRYGYEAAGISSAGLARSMSPKPTNGRWTKPGGQSRRSTLWRLRSR
jgi:alkanesulfonate monooxygenase SsuD/methylene tetrahydromethanopterin reductase-like flavin-dependent oxidoreductase (luciferase family)